MLIPGDWADPEKAEEKQLGTGVSTGLLFMPDEKRDIRKPLDVTNKAMNCTPREIFLTCPVCSSHYGDSQSEGGTLAVIAWMGRVSPSHRPRHGAGLLFLLGGLCQNDNGQNSSTTSKASSTALSPLLPPVMSPTSHWQGVPSTLTKERGLRREEL